MVRCKAHFDIFNRLGMDHECDRQTDGHMDGQNERRFKFPTRNIWHTEQGCAKCRVIYIVLSDKARQFLASEPENKKYRGSILVV